MEENKPTKNKLNYSTLSDTVCFVDSKGKKIELHQNFVQAMLLWLNEGELPPVGSTAKRELTAGGQVHWRFTCERIAE